MKYPVLLTLFLVTSAPLVAQPVVSVSPTTHDFGTIDVGKTKAQTFRVSNTGSDTLEGIASLLAGVHFSLSQADSFRVGPGGFSDVIVTFSPTRPGEQFDSLMIAHNDTNSTSPLGIALSGVGIPRPQVSVRPGSFDFDTVAVRTSVETVFWVGNPGSGQLTVRASIGMGSPHYVVTTTTELFTVAAGDSAAVIVQYAPTSQTRHTGQLRIDHNGSNVSTPTLVGLAGVGAQAVTIDPNEPNNVSFDATEIEAGFVSDSTEIWPNGDVDYFTFRGIYGEWIEITVDVTATSTLNSKLWLYNADGVLLAENDNAGSTDRSQINDTLRASGIYFVRVAFAGNNIGFPNAAASKSQGEDPTGEYRLTLVRTGNDPLGTPTLVSPADSVFDERVDPTLTWSPVDGAKNYDLIVASSNNFLPGSVVFQSSRSDTAVVAPGLPPGTALFWHVRAGNELGAGGFSSVRLFQTTFAPVVISPIDDFLLPEGSVSVDLRPVFSDPEGGALVYRVESLSDSSVVATEIQGPQLNVTAIGSGSTVVTVAAQDPKGAEANTSFSVIAGAATDSEQDELPPGEFGIGSNYPNPFSGKTSIPVSIAKSSDVELSVFDLIGSKVRVLVNGKMTAGIHEIEFSSGALAPGVYLIRLEADGHTAVSSLVIGQ